MLCTLLPYVWIFRDLLLVFFALFIDIITPNQTIPTTTTEIPTHSRFIWYEF